MKTIKKIIINTKAIGDDQPPFIIAEMSGNHNKSLNRAVQIVDEAAKTGVDAIKLQTYTPDTMTVRGAYTIQGDSPWKGRELYDLYEEAHTPWDWHKEIFERAKKQGLIVFSTPFDESAVDFLEELDVPAYKIASFENTDWPLLKKVASTGKPVIMSTGAASLSDIEGAVNILRSNGCKDLVLLKCTSTYPATPENSNLNTIPHMRELFGCHVGLSDHTLGIGAAVASVALGARVIEKHFTLDRSEGGVDSTFSLEPAEMKSLVEEAKNAHTALGNIHYGILADEEKSRVFKRSLIAVKDIEKGDVLNNTNVKILRPGLGIEPKHFEKVIGMHTSTKIAKGSPVTWKDLGL